MIDIENEAVEKVDIYLFSIGKHETDYRYPETLLKVVDLLTVLGIGV